MKQIAWVILVLGSSLIVMAQASAPAQGSNPVVSTVRDIEARQSKNLIGAADAMPAEKYSYRPTPPQMTFGHLMTHVAESNYTLCGRIAGEQPKVSELRETDPKATLSQAVKDSFAYCEQALGKTDDSKIAEEVTLYGGKKGPRAAALIYLVSGWADHYSAAAIYLRLNDILPPSAKK